IEDLQKTFITPIDREDIHTLAIQLDHAMDMINGVARKIEAYEIRSLPHHFLKFSELILSMTCGLREILHLLESEKPVQAECERMHRMENACDDVFHAALAELFHSDITPVEVIQYKELYEILETCSDTINYVAKLVLGIKVKQG
ncbi:MAG TPA: DUF47 family protein, partial [Fibrobacteraceae bacterium]|nr:DUF47 family protein [Fibrobacteraceae bacterium]